MKFSDMICKLCCCIADLMPVGLGIGIAAWGLHMLKEDADWD